MIRTLLRWACNRVLRRRTDVAIPSQMPVIVVMIVTVIKPAPRRGNSIPRTATAILVAVWLVVIHTVSNGSADLVVGSAAVASVGDTTTDNQSTQRRDQHCDTPAR